MKNSMILIAAQGMFFGFCTRYTLDVGVGVCLGTLVINSALVTLYGLAKKGE